jgi:cell division protease FtsH
MGLLSTLLIEMSGFGQEHGWRARWRAWFYRTFLRREPPQYHKRVLTIGATNRISALDPALLRPGRFDKKIRVDVPDMLGRRDIFEYYLSKTAHDESMDPAILATETPGYSPADIKYLLNESLRYALFDGRRYVTYRDFRLAQPEHEMGLRAPLKHMSAEATWRLAHYQAGQAVAVRLFLPAHRIARITIIRQGQAFGHVWHYSARDEFQDLDTKDDALRQLRVLIAGKAAEMEFCGLNHQTLSVGEDFREIRETLARMVWCGMFGAMGASMQYGAVLTDDQLHGIEETYQMVLTETRHALRENAHVVEALVKLLLEKEELLADEVRAFFDQYGLYTPDPVAIIDGKEVSLLPSLPKEQEQLPAPSA